MRINPDCESTIVNQTEDCSKDTLSLIHIKSDGPRDSLHFLWSFIGAPTLLLARTPLNTNLSVDWSLLLLEGSGNPITFNPAPFYIFGWSLVTVKKHKIRCNILCKMYNKILNAFVK